MGFALICDGTGEVAAQQAQVGVYATGNAAVTGFSGAPPPIQIAPGIDPNQMTFIDPNGPSLRVVDLQHMGGPPAAQVVGAPKPLAISATLIGQVFGVALDDSSPPNIYAAASSVYGLPIVAPGPDGQPRHVQAGAPNANFMPGLWGRHGGPGSIWKINGVNGQVSLFANVAVGNRANSGPALGGLAYDSDSKSLFVADRETGLIHRFGLNGSDLGTYDHGVTARAALGLAPASWNPQPGIDVTSPQFDSTQPATWNYAAPPRFVFGLAVYQHRLYYAVAESLQVWSVSLDADGSFGSDAQIEIAVPPAAGPTEISKITFDGQGRMYLAERPAPTGAFDFEALAVASIGRSLRYTVIGTTASGQRIWQQAPDEYSIGFPPIFRNDNGGVAIGYSYNESGDLNLGSCGGFMWSTGEQLRNASDPALAARLGNTGELSFNGLQGNATWRIKRDDEPPLESYFIDYADEYPDPASRGHMGDIAIERLCTPAKPAMLVPPVFPSPFPKGNPPGYPPNPPRTPPAPPHTPPATPVCMPWQVCGPHGGPVCPPNYIWREATNSCERGCERPEILVGGKCCPVGALTATAACSNSSCSPGQTAIGPSNFCCDSSQVYSNGSGQACCVGKVVNGKCQPLTPPTTNPNCPPGSTNPQCCAKGYVSTGKSCCLASQTTSTGTCCPNGQIPGGTNKSQCLLIIRIPIGKQCCATGLVPAGNGACCPAANLTTSGTCCSGPVDPKNRKQCPVDIHSEKRCTAGYTMMPDGNCCNSRYLSADGKSCNTGQPTCAAGQFRDTNGACVSIPMELCPRGEERDRNGNCVHVGPPPSSGAGTPPSRITPPGVLIPRRPGPTAPSRGPTFRDPVGGPGLFRR